VESVTVEGRDIIVELKEPDSTWKYMPSHMGTYIYSQADVEANLEAYGTPEHFPLGSGPYMVTEFVPDSHIVMERNPHYWGEPGQFEELRFDIIPDNQTRFLAMQSGDIDGTFDVPSAAISQWEGVSTLARVPGYIFRGFTVDMDQEPFSDIHVRRALYYATDRVGISEGLFPGQAVAASTLNTPAIYDGILPADEVEAAYGEMEDFSFDLDKAREELAMSSVPDGFSTVLNVPDGSEAALLISQSIKETWGQVGIDVELNLMPGGPRFQIILDHGPNLGVQIIGNVPDVPDPLQMLQLYYNSAEAAPNGNNSSNFRDDEVDALIQEGLQSTDPAEAARTALEVQRLAAEQVPIIPVLWSDFTFAVRSDWSLGPMNGFSISHNFVESLQVS
jgi:peptide/nickel transport system substrate-binding protein